MHSTKTGKGNTKKPSQRGRNWCFTQNNFTKSDIEICRTIKGEYIFQEETGKEGTPHLQGVLMFDSAKTFEAVKKLLPKAHLELCKDKSASMAYCQKEETRTGQVYLSKKYLPKMDLQDSIEKMLLEETGFKNYDQMAQYYDKIGIY